MAGSKGKVMRSDPAMPAGLAAFVARAAQQRAKSADEWILDALRSAWVAAMRDGGAPPDVRAVAQAVGRPASTVRTALNRLLVIERVIRAGRGRNALWVPNEPEFTGGLEEGGAE